jgi:hypothetical protein
MHAPIAWEKSFAEEILQLVDQVPLEIICHHRVVVVGLILSAAGFIVVFDVPGVAILFAEILGSIVQGILVTGDALWLDLQIHPFRKFWSGVEKEDGDIAQRL